MLLLLYYLHGYGFTCSEQLFVNVLVYCEIDVVVLLAAAGQVAVDGVVSRLEDSVLGLLLFFSSIG